MPTFTFLYQWAKWNTQFLTYRKAWLTRNREKFFNGHISEANVHMQILVLMEMLKRNNFVRHADNVCRVNIYLPTAFTTVRCNNKSHLYCRNGFSTEHAGSTEERLWAWKLINDLFSIIFIAHSILLSVRSITDRRIIRTVFLSTDKSIESLIRLSFLDKALALQCCNEYQTFTFPAVQNSPVK